jgi:exodeoxyribonuclease VII large subunit
MCTVLVRRFPNLEIRLFPVKVQGEGASLEIAGGIRYFQTSEWRPDVLIVGRGGGSVEDLWAFNEEAAVYAVAQSAIPVISAVGHESDTTLCDHVADLRAGTPSIAAERAVPVKSELVAQVTDLVARLSRAPRRQAEVRIQQIDNLELRLGGALANAAVRLERRLRDAEARLSPSLKDVASRMEVRLQRAVLRFKTPLPAALDRYAGLLREQEARLRLLNPYAVLERGYSITADAAGHVVRHAADVAAGDRLKTRFADGTVESVAV